MGAFQEYLKSAISSIRMNKVRSFLTMLGIIIGIMSVLIVLVIGDGFSAQMKAELNRNVTAIKVRINKTRTDKYFTREYYKQIEEAFGDKILGMDAEISFFGEITDYRGRTFDVEASGHGTGDRFINDYSMLYGRFFTADEVMDGAYVCVLPACNCVKLFGYDNVIGETINITFEDKSADYTIIGVRKDTDLDKTMLEFNTITATAPYTTICEAHGINPDAQISAISLVTDSDHRAEVYAKSVSVVENVCELRGLKAIRSENGNSMGAMERILNMVKSVVILIAAISLVVGGIGVMNIMTVSVTERTREIGIRKSLGARTHSIMIQFLAEAAILTVIGGFVGMALGLLIAFGVSQVAKFPFVVDVSSVVIVVGISIFIGLFFGIAPAYRAAKLNPIDALHQD